MRTFLFGVLLFMASSLSAQPRCVSSDYLDLQRSLDPRLGQKLHQIEEEISGLAERAARENGEGAATILRIPVVVHILYNTLPQNISDAQVQSQIDALNRDFRRKNADSTLTPAVFKNLGADLEIEFMLATTDPQGRPTNGIIHKYTSVQEWRMDDRIKFSAEGGDDAWDSRSYLNIWVGQMRSILGYSTVPGTDEKKDGVVINVSAFGTLNTAAPYHLGRTAVHEVGHWLGLKHIWGDSYCGEDGVDDTPKQGNFTPGCPNGYRTSCSNGATGDMYMNYMDFTFDACMNLFTRGQKDRIWQYITAGPRSALLHSKGLSQPWNFEPPENGADVMPKVFRVYPNPVQQNLMVELPTSWIGQTLVVVNAQGVIVLRVKMVQENQAINLSILSRGVYVLQGDYAGEKIRAKLVKL